MVPDFNNVYGRIKAPKGLAALRRAIGQVVVDGRTRIEVSGCDGARTLHLESASLDFETTPLGGDEHLFNGGVGGTAEEVFAFVEALSRALSAAGVEHAFEVYDGAKNLMRSIPGAPDGRGSTPLK